MRGAERVVWYFWELCRGNAWWPIARPQKRKEVKGEVQGGIRSRLLIHLWPICCFYASRSEESCGVARVFAASAERALNGR